MYDAALRARLDPDRLSFINAVHLLCDAIAEFSMVAPEQQPLFYQRHLWDIARYQLPKRDTHVNPRVVKRKMSNFQRKRAAHRQWPQPSMTVHAAVPILNSTVLGLCG